MRYKKKRGDIDGQKKLDARENMEKRGPEGAQEVAKAGMIMGE